MSESAGIQEKQLFANASHESSVKPNLGEHLDWRKAAAVRELAGQQTYGTIWTAQYYLEAAHKIA